tara:strand:+ start:3535 stop:4110 length:576 start_codon:yes stop_codon:yes gene_type:complete
MTDRQKYGHQISNLETFTTGMSFPAALQYLFNRRLKEDGAVAASRTYPQKAIVRFSVETSDKSLIESTGIQQTINSAASLTGINEKAIVLFLEMPGYTETYSKFISGKIAKDDFYSSLLRVVLPPMQSNRTPVSNEIVLVDYDDPTDFISIKFAGYPSELIQLDSNLNSYTRLGKASGKVAFKDAKGQSGV